VTRVLNSSPKIIYKIFVRGHGKHDVIFESVKTPWWYRIFRKPNGKLIAFEEMSTGQEKGWDFVASCLTPDELPTDI